MEDLIKQINELKQELQGIRTETIADIIAECVPAIVVNLETNVIVYSTSLADSLFGYMEGELRGKSINDIIPERFHVLHNQHVQDYARKPVPKAMGHRDNMELFGKSRDGSQFKVEISLHPRAIAGKRYVIATILKNK